MTEFGLFALATFLSSVVVGVAIHELAHGAVLRALGYDHEYRVELGDGDTLRARLSDASICVEWAPLYERARGVEIAVGAVAPLAVAALALTLIELDAAPGLTRYVLAGVALTNIPSPADVSVAVRGLRWWDDELAGTLDAIANHESAEGYDPIL